jgi:flagellar hook assembly protein FlgD
MAYGISDAYPNPFNPTTTIGFGLAVDSEVSIQIYNLQGRVIETLANQFMQAGYHSVTWNANNYSSGVYFVKMATGDYVSTQKLLLVK